MPLIYRLQRFVVCSECGWRKGTNMNSGHKTMFLFHDSMCPSCGNKSHITDFANFLVETRRWIPAEKTWWKPWTWCKGKWTLLEEEPCP